MEMIVLRPEDQDTILEFEERLLNESDADDFMDKQLKSWHARWRKESLEHYLPLGWSFGIWESHQKLKLLGYALCQPLLFFRGMTQTLWVEHLSAETNEISQKLGEIVYRWSRDKHLQQLILPKEVEDAVITYDRQDIGNELVVINTSKLRS